jgi:DNA-3-methyladenine glycosylase
MTMRLVEPEDSSSRGFAARGLIWGSDLKMRGMTLGKLRGSSCTPTRDVVRRSIDFKPIGREFFSRSAQRVARELLGKVLVRQDDAEFLAGRIVETEAYLAEDDPAAHSAAGKTARNAVLFGPPGHAYIYFIYGNHYCLNVSCDREGTGGGVLFRALEPLCGIEQMARNRGIAVAGARDLRKLTSGPGRLAQAFGITRARDNGRDLVSESSGLWIAKDGFRVGGVSVTPRIGITKAAEQPLRFVLEGNPFVSGRKLRAFG